MSDYKKGGVIIKGVKHTSIYLANLISKSHHLPGKNNKAISFIFNIILNNYLEAEKCLVKENVASYCIEKIKLNKYF